MPRAPFGLPITPPQQIDVSDVTEIPLPEPNSADAQLPASLPSPREGEQHGTRRRTSAAASAAGHRARCCRSSQHVAQGGNQNHNIPYSSRTSQAISIRPERRAEQCAGHACKL